MIDRKNHMCFLEFHLCVTVFYLKFLCSRFEFLMFFVIGLLLCNKKKLE